MKKLGIIGVGEMGGAMLKGLLRGGLAPVDVVFFEKMPERAEAIARSYGVESAGDLPSLVRSSRYILLCVKPKDVREVAAAVAPVMQEAQVIVSIVTGLQTKDLREMFGTRAPIVRLMPNLAVGLGEGAVGLAFGDPAGETLRSEITSFLAPLGRLVEVNEDLMDVVTAVSGCSPAYICLVLEGMIDGGVMLGLTRAKARALAVQAMLGTAKLLEAEDLEPAVLKGRVESPGGATIAGSVLLEDRAVKGSVARAIEAAAKRAKELRT